MKDSIIEELSKSIEVLGEETDKAISIDLISDISTNTGVNSEETLINSEKLLTSITKDTNITNPLDTQTSNKLALVLD